MVFKSKISSRSMFNRIKHAAYAVTFAAVTFSPALLSTNRAYAAVTNPTPTAKVSFTFDDGLISSLTQAAPTLAKYGFTGTNYAITSCVGMNTVPNTCKANTDASYMTWAQIAQLQSTYKWEIGSHTATHPLLASKDASIGQSKKLTIAQVRKELTDSKAALASHGINATSFAPPFGDYDKTVLAEIAKEYGTMRGFADTGYNSWPYNEYLVRDQQVQAGVSVAMVKSYIDTAIANKQWLVLTFHDIKTNASTNPDDYEYKTADLDLIAAYVKSKNIPVVNMNQAATVGDTNLLANGSFDTGIANGWTTDNATAFTKDTAKNGSFPNATNSIKVKSGTTAAHLFSPKVTINPGTTYLLKNYLNAATLTSGEVAYYIDEYNTSGAWISGQYKMAKRASFVDNMNFTYTPSSTAVASAALQISISANSGITGYIDNAEWYALTTVPVTPPVTPPTATNLMPNGTFDAGIAGGWTTDASATITKDILNNGAPANVQNSAKLVATTKNTHLFAPKITLTAGKSYAMSGHLNVQQLTSGEVGFYIDEYDANGAWISGQYKTGVRNVSTGTVSFAYTPSSTNVRSSSLQIIVSANSGITAYFDDVQMIQTN